MVKVLCIGSACKDMFFPTTEGKIIETPDEITSQRKIAFELGAKYKIKEHYEALGGCAANVAVGLARLGTVPSTISIVGDDQSGSWILEELRKNGVDTQKAIVQKGGKSDLSAIIIDSMSADRVIFSNKNSSGDLKLDADKIKEADWIFLGDIHGKWGEQMEEIIELAKKGNKKIALNPRELHIHEDPAEIIEAIGLSEVVFLNKDEAVEVVSKMNADVSLDMINEEKFLLGKLIGLEPKIVALTDGKRGAWVADGERIIFAEGLNVPALDSTGAGDAFLSGFLAAYIKEKSPEECLQWGIANSASGVQYYGAIEGLLDEEKILEKIKDVKTEIV